MADVFISYHEASAGELAEEIADRLEDAGISCWCARRDMPLGGNFAREIPSRIHDCRLFLLILNESVYHSEHIESEVGIAFSRRNKQEDIRILPLEIGDFTRKGWVEYYLIHAQSVKFPENPDEQRIQRLVKRIAKLLGKAPAPQQKPKSESPIQTPPPKAKTEPPAKIIKIGECGDNLIYTLYENGLLSIFGTGPMWDFEWNGANYNTPWWDKREMISHIALQGAVSAIGEGAFRDCTEVIRVHIPDSVNSIGDNAFNGCSKLINVTIPNSVAHIGQWAFYDCVGMTSITIPDSVTYIARWAFFGCDKLTSVSVSATSYISVWSFPATTRIERRG